MKLIAKGDFDIRKLAVIPMSFGLSGNKRDGRKPFVANIGRSGTILKLIIAF